MKIVHFFLLVFLCPLVACGQTEELQILERRVKQVEQFIARFNGGEKMNGTKTPLDKNAKKDAWATIISGKTIELKNKFFEQVFLDSNAKLDINSNDIFAFVECDFILDNKQENLQLTLKNEGNIKEGFRWAIVGAKADFLGLKQTTKNDLGSVSPAAHNLNFIDLKKAVNKDSKNINKYTAFEYVPDHLAVLLYLIKNGKIQIKEIGEVSFYLFDIKNWVIRLEYIKEEENSQNSGWLITELNEIPNDKKNEYKQKILFVD